MGYIRDGFNPRGAEYAATARAADAAQATQRSTDDMLRLAMAESPEQRRVIAGNILANRAADAARTKRNNNIRNIILAVLIAPIAIAVAEPKWIDALDALIPAPVVLAQPTAATQSPIGVVMQIDESANVSVDAPVAPVVNDREIAAAVEAEIAQDPSLAAQNDVAANVGNAQ